jgi:hypothetical protein
VIGGVHFSHPDFRFNRAQRIDEYLSRWCQRALAQVDHTVDRAQNLRVLPL